MPLTRQARDRIAQALGPDAADGIETGHTLLCRREAGAFQRAAKSGEELLVACTQESRLFLELAAETEGAPSLQERPIRFVDIRETGGWSRAAREAPDSVVPKIAALVAAAQLPPPDPVPTVSYRSAGRVLVIGTANRAQRAAEMLADKLDVSLLITGAKGNLPQPRTIAVHAGRVKAIAGWLGAFDVQWESSNPIDLDKGREGRGRAGSRDTKVRRAWSRQRLRRERSGRGSRCRRARARERTTARSPRPRARDRSSRA